MKGLLFTFALTYGGAIISLFNPFYGLLIYVCFAIIRPECMWAYSVPGGGNYSRIIGIALLVGWALSGFGNWALGRSRAIALCLIGFICWMALATVFAAYPDESWLRVESLSKVVLPFLVGLTVIHSLKQLQLLSWTILLSEGYLAFRLNHDYYAGIFNPENPLRFADLDNNGVAITMVATAGLAFFCGLAATARWRRWLAFALACLIVHVVLFSDSRGGMLALIISATASFFLIRKQPSHYLYFLVAILIGLRLAGPPVIQRFSTVFAAPEERDASAESRLDLSGTMLRIMGESPITGIGAGNFILLSQNYGWSKGKDGHTTWLQVGAENGIPAMVLLLSFYILTIKQCWRMRQPRLMIPDELIDIGRMSIASLVGFMVSAQFVTVYGVELPYYIALLGASAVKLADLEWDAGNLNPELDSELANSNDRIWTSQQAVN